MGDVEKMVGGFRSSIQDLLVPELKAINVEIRSLRERMDKMDTRLGKHDEKFEKIFITLEQHNEKFERIFTTLDQHNEKFEKIFMILDQHNEKFERIFITLEKHNEKFERIFGAFAQLEKTQEVILNRLDYGERISDLEIRFEKLEHFIKKAS